MAMKMNEVVQHLGKIVLQHDGAGLTDGQLLGRFIEQRDEAAIAALIRRHGPMVWGVCHRILRDHHDAEDAFQATFLVLVRRASAIAPREMVGNWLYGVAYRTALKAKAMLAKRRTREKQVTAMPETVVEQQDFWHDLQPVLDRELSRLPDKYRVAIVLCDLEGKTRMEAAGQLGVPPGTLASRLTRGRALLAKRLTRHGLAMSGGTLAVEFARNAVSACQPTSLMTSTIKAVTAVAAGQAASTGVISASVAALTEGMVKTMLLSKLKIAAGVLLVLTVSTAGGLLYQTQAAGKPEDAPRVEQKKEKMQRHPPDISRHFKHRIPVQIGFTEFNAGGHIDILEIWGTRPKIEVGGVYLVRGKYAMPSHDRGKLYLWLTADGWNNTGYNDDLQQTDVRKGQGEFTLLHEMRGPGFFHLKLIPDDGKGIANVYFGTDDKALKYRP